MPTALRTSSSISFANFAKVFAKVFPFSATALRTTESPSFASVSNTSEGVVLCHATNIRIRASLSVARAARNSGEACSSLTKAVFVSYDNLFKSIVTFILFILSENKLFFTFDLCINKLHYKKHFRSIGAEVAMMLFFYTIFGFCLAFFKSFLCCDAYIKPFVLCKLNKCVRRCVLVSHNSRTNI